MEIILASRSLPADGIRREVRRKNLDGYRALQARITGAIHFPHAACTKRAVNLVGAKSRSRDKGHLSARL